MKTICFYFQVHQPFRIRKYRFFDIGNDHYYWDDYANKSILRKVAEKCYLPANKLFLQLIKEWGCRFKISYSISGDVIDQFQMFAPDVLDSFRRLADTGCVEFLGETFSHSLSALRSKNEFIEQVEDHTKLTEMFFGQKPKVFRNTELIYSDSIGEMIADLGFNAMISEGAKHVLGWKSPNFLYCNAHNPKLKILLRNYRLSDDIAFRFSNRSWSEWPLSTDKFLSWILATEAKEEIFNIFLDYESFGEHQWAETGIFDFLKDLPRKALTNGLQFKTPSEVAASYDPVGTIHVPYPISWADEERDLTAWLGNELQDEAFSSLYDLYDRVKTCTDPHIQRDWKYLQTSDHFYYMCTKWFSDGDVHKYFNPYGSPYEAYINYMNVLSDFIDRLNKLVPAANQADKTTSPAIDEKPTVATMGKTKTIKKTDVGKKAVGKKAKEKKTKEKKVAVKKTTEGKKTKENKTEIKKVKPATVASKNSQPAKAAIKKTVIKKAKAVKPAKVIVVAKAEKKLAPSGSVKGKAKTIAKKTQVKKPGKPVIKKGGKNTGKTKKK